MRSQRLDSGDPGQVIPLSVPCLAGNEWEYVRQCLDTGWVSSVGPFVNRFERELAAYVDAGYAVAMVNGTAALHVALLTVGVEPGDEVIVPDLTFVAPANAIRYCQAHPVFIDADPVTWQLDVAKLAEFLGEACEMRDGQCINVRTGRRVHAVVPVHLLGLASEIDTIVALARQHGLRVVEDAAEAMGVRYRERHVGTFGDIGVFSFNGNKVMTTGGGGMLVTDERAHAERARYLSTQAKDDPLEYVHQEIGYNYRLTNVQAAIGVAQLEQLDDFVARKRTIARTYEEAFGGLDGITLMPSLAHGEPTYWLYTVLLEENVTLRGRQSVIEGLRRNGVGARPIWHTLHDLPPFRGCQAYRIEHAPRLYRRGVSLPSSVGLGAEQLDRCIRVLSEAVGSGR